MKKSFTWWIGERPDIAFPLAVAIGCVIIAVIAWLLGDFPPSPR